MNFNKPSCENCWPYIEHCLFQEKDSFWIKYQHGQNMMHALCPLYPSHLSPPPPPPPPNYCPTIIYVSFTKNNFSYVFRSIPNKRICIWRIKPIIVVADMVGVVAKYHGRVFSAETHSGLSFHVQDDVRRTWAITSVTPDEICDDEKDEQGNKYANHNTHCIWRAFRSIATNCK